MIHRGTAPADPGWNRQYIYEGDLGSSPSRKTNRLIRTQPAGPHESSRTDYEYDEHGNMIKMPHLPVMKWDFKDQLQATTQQVITSGTPEMTYYVYDSAGQRVRKVTESQASAGQTPTRIKERIYLGGFEIYREFKSDGVTINLERESLHVMDDKQRIALLETKTINNQSPVSNPQPLIRYQFGNHLGSASLELDDKANVVSYEQYYPYGGTSYQAVRKDIEVPLKRYRYTGKERDEESGLYYHGARYYAPWLGRWTSCDQQQESKIESLYVFVVDNPLKFIDPDGLEEQPVDMREFWGVPSKPIPIEDIQKKLQQLQGKELDKLSKHWMITQGGKPAQKYLAYLDQPAERRIFRALLKSAEASNISVNFLAATVFSEGLNLWMDEDYSKNKNAEIGGFSRLGADRFGKEYQTLIKEGFLRSDFGKKEFYIRKGEELEGETGEKHPKVIFRNIESGIEAVAAMLAYRRSLLIADLQLAGIDTKQLSEEELNYWTGVYYNAGSGSPEDPYGQGRAIVLQRAKRGVEALTIPTEDLPIWVIDKKGEPHKNPLAIGQSRIATERLFAFGGLQCVDER